jgi:hypothetical protein|uniref:Uncharacterized protein n=1 Tax=uncultured microorganism TaxID=358574 RepID=A0A1L3KS69_9ZZZZ|nr:hypothetical protein [uncultured microorganism]
MTNEKGIRKKVQYGVELDYLTQARIDGFQDFNAWIAHLIETIQKKDMQCKQLQRELLAQGTQDSEPTGQNPDSGASLSDVVKPHLSE